jgi:hypothetical protein
MRRRVLRWIVSAVLVAVVLGGTFLIVERNQSAMSGSARTPAGGMLH